MAAQRYKDILFSYGSLISSADEIQRLSNYFAEIQNSVAQAEYSELMDLRKYTIKRHASKIKKMLLSNRNSPFLFISCLN